MGNTRIDARARFERLARTGLYGPIQWVSFGQTGFDLRAQLVRELGLCGGESILDVATGTGYALPHLAAAVGHAGRVVGVDFSPGMLDQARRIVSHLPHVVLREADATQLPFEDESFDVAVSTYGVSCIPQAEKAVAEMARVVRPGGTIGIAEATSVNWRSRRVSKLVTRLVSPVSVWYPERQLAPRLVCAGLTVQTRPTGRPSLQILIARKTAS